MVHCYLTRFGLGLALSVLASTQVQSQSELAQSAALVGTSRSFIAASGLRLAPPGTEVNSELADLVATDRLRLAGPVSSRLAPSWRRNSEPTSIGDWSVLLAGPPSGRLHQSATYDPKRNRVFVFGGVTHVWPHGDLSYLELDGAQSWHHIDPELSPPSRWGHTMIYDAARDRLILFGGLGASCYDICPPPLDDVWALALDTLEWKQLLPSGAAPSARLAHSAIYDPVGDRMIVFGGYDGGFLNDVWQLTLDGDGAWSRLAPAGAPPPGLDAAAAVYDPIRHRMVVFGGFDGFHSRNDVWALALGEMTRWSPIRTLGSRPAIRRQHGTIYDEVRDRLVVFGGTDGNPGPGYDDVWVLPLGSRPTWQMIRPAGTSPSPRWGHSLFYQPIEDRAVLFGGVDLTDWLQDTWELSLSNPAWKAFEEPVVPAARWGHSSILDPAHDRLLVFMGAGQAKWYTDLWELDLGGAPVWRAVTAAGAWPYPRQDASAIHDPVRGRVLLFGGRTWFPTGDVWELSLEGTPTWRYVAPEVACPVVRTAHTAIYDPLRDRMLVFGGYDDFQEQNDLWVLSMSGTPKWSQLVVPGPAPDIRQYHSAVYDAGGDRMLVFGGISWTRNSTYDDVWVLGLADDPRWIHISTRDSPQPRSGHEAIWDERSERMLVFGGIGPEGPQNDIWSLTLSTRGDRGEWQELDPGGPAPPRRTGHSAVLDPSRNRMLVFGGKTDAAFFSDASALALGPAGAAAAQRPRDGNGTEAASTRSPEVSITRVGFDPEGRSFVATVNLPAQGPARFMITDVRGRRIVEQTLEEEIGEASLEFDLGGMAQGIYWLRVTQNGRSASARFAKLRQ